jgi:hypothetical protein
MERVRPGEAPSARIVAQYTASVIVRDPEGRELSVRRLTALDRLRLFKAVGPDLSQNAPYLGMAMLAVAVTAIDGVPVPAPVTEAQLEALVLRLGDGGIAAVAEWLHAAEAAETDAGN